MKPRKDKERTTDEIPVMFDVKQFNAKEIAEEINVMHRIETALVYKLKHKDSLSALDSPQGTGKDCIMLIHSLPGIL